MTRASDVARLRDALEHVPPHDRDTWLRIGMAVKAELGEDGFPVWDEWSQADESYNERDAKSVWKSIRPAGKVTIGTLFHEAKRRGWHGEESNGSGHLPSRTERAEREQRRQQEQEGEARRRQEAQQVASEIWSSSKPAPEDHAYLVRKGVKTHGTRIYSGSRIVRDMSCDGALLVPVRNARGELCSLEFISAEGEKRFLPGGRKSGGYFSIGRHAGVIVISEGFATGASVHEATGHATAVAFDKANLRPVAIALRRKFPDARIIIAADDDRQTAGNPGVTGAREAAAAICGAVAIPDSGADQPAGAKDFNDMMLVCGADAVRAAIEAAKVQPRGTDCWPAAIPLPQGLPPVAQFDYELLPSALHRKVEDIAERMQCPPDFPAVALMTMLASILGRRCGIAPKRADDWTVVPNLWGMVIGRPGIMKSPPLTEIMKPLQALQMRARELFGENMAEYQAGSIVADEAERVARDAIRKMLKAGKPGAAQERAEEVARMDANEPVCRRYIVNDSTVEKLGEILNENPTGVLLFRDELNGFFRMLERQGHEADRAFYLECWNGDGSFTYDRIGRGTLHIAGACLSVLGSIQPGPLSDLVRGLRGSGDDGMLQRFQLAVWPDVCRDWSNVDRPPDRAAHDAVQRVIERFDRMTAETLGADPGHVPVLRFSEGAQPLFDVWREALELRLRDESEHPMLEAHLAKYRSLVPSIALLIHLTETGEGPVELLALERAVAWAEYLETHARRIYAPAISSDMDAARLLTKRIAGGAVGATFALRDIYNNGWSGLSTREQVMAAVSVLMDHDYLRSFEEQTTGRSRTVYRVNPAVIPERAL